MIDSVAPLKGLLYVHEFESKRAYSSLPRLGNLLVCLLINQLLIHLTVDFGLRQVHTTRLKHITLLLALLISADLMTSLHSFITHLYIFQVDYI